ncbi:MAG: ABC transporter permease [Chloroflexi bacterium]|nr:ABC transporter permease [Chloroflexota bacterium]
MFWRILMQSLRHRWKQILIAVLAITLGASLAAAALSVSVGMDEKVGRTLRAYGANLILVPTDASLGATDATFKASDLARLNETKAVLAYAPFLYGVVESHNQPVVLVGTSIDAAVRVNSWWTIEPGIPTDSQAALVGVNVAKKWALKVSDPLTVRFRDQEQTFHVAGVLTAGGAEDDQVIVPLAAAQTLLGRLDQVSLVQVSALTSDISIETTARALEQSVPGAQAKTVRQIAEGEVTLLRRVQLLLALIAAIVLLAAGLSVGATMATVMMERRREVALMKALGAEARRIGSLFLAEAGALGVLGGILGYVLGFAFAQIIAQSVFASAVGLNLWVAAGSLGIAVSVAVIGSVIPMRRALAVESAVILRGE